MKCMLPLALGLFFGDATRRPSIALAAATSAGALCVRMLPRSLQLVTTIPYKSCEQSLVAAPQDVNLSPTLSTCHSTFLENYVAKSNGCKLDVLRITAPSLTASGAILPSKGTYRPQSGNTHMVVPEIRVHHMKGNPTIWGSIWGSPIFVNPPYALG